MFSLSPKTLDVLKLSVLGRSGQERDFRPSLDQQIDEVVCTAWSDLRKRRLKTPYIFRKLLINITK